MKKCPIIECNLSTHNCRCTRPHGEIYRVQGPFQPLTNVKYFECIRYKKFFQDDGEEIIEIPEREGVKE